MNSQTKKELIDIIRNAMKSVETKNFKPTVFSASDCANEVVKLVLNSVQSMLEAERFKDDDEKLTKALADTVMIYLEFKKMFMEKFQGLAVYPISVSTAMLMFTAETLQPKSWDIVEETTDTVEQQQENFPNVDIWDIDLIGTEPTDLRRCRVPDVPEQMFGLMENRAHDELRFCAAAAIMAEKGHTPYIHFSEDRLQLFLTCPKCNETVLVAPMKPRALKVLQ